MSSPDARRLATVFVELADTLVSDFDVIEFLHLLTQRCVEVMGVDAAGLLMTNQRDRLQLVAASAARAAALERIQLESRDGPGSDCFAAGVAIGCADLRAEPLRWPSFAKAAETAGFRAVHSLPLRLRGDVIGALSVFTAEPGTLDDSTLALGQGLADLSTIGVMHQRALRQQAAVTAQLQGALNSRVVIEQAKGALAERHGVPVDHAFAHLRAYARRHHLRLSDLSHAVVTGTGPHASRLNARFVVD